MARELSVLKGVAAALMAVMLLAMVSPGSVVADVQSAPTQWFDVDFELAQAMQRVQGEEAEAELQNPALVGHLPLVFNTDVWAHGDFAYVGTFGFEGFCPATGVKVVDISDPTSPELVTTIPSHPGTRANDVKVAEIETDFFEGVLLAHSDEPCGAEGINGFHLFDVTDPADPAHLSQFETGPVHNLFLFQQEDRAFVLLAVPFAEVFGPLFGDPHPSDFQIVEVTDPQNPVLVGEWTIGRDAGLAFGSPFFAGIPVPGADCTPPPGTPELCRGDDFPGVFNHDVWADEEGEVAYLSYWDAGLILLDIEDPASPALIGRGVEPPAFGSDEGNAHAAVPADDGDLVLVTDEDFTPEPWGLLRIFDTEDPTAPTQVGSFALTGFGGAFSAHNLVVEDDLVFLSWYTAGIRVFDFSDPTAPQEVASFKVPLEQSFTLFWGVYVLDDVEVEGEDEDFEDLLILGSDIFTGLYLFRLSEDEVEFEDAPDFEEDDVVWHRLNPREAPTSPEHEVLGCRTSADAWTCRYDKIPEPALGFEDPPEGTFGNFFGREIPLSGPGAFACLSGFPFDCADVVTVVQGTMTFHTPAAPALTLNIQLIVTTDDVLHVYWMTPHNFVCPWYPTFDEALAANPFPVPFNGVDSPANDCVFGVG